MPIHDWTRVDAGLFHAFHHDWITSISHALNRGILPDDFFALPEQHAAGAIPDVLTLKLDGGPIVSNNAGIAVAVQKPKAKIVQRRESELDADKADRISIRHRHGEVIAVIEIVSPGNKSSRAALRAFIEKASDLIHRGIHLLVVDLFPPGKRDPQGIHKLIWDEITDEDFEVPVDQPLIFASYDAGLERVAYVNFAAVGEPVPEMPIFLRPERYVNVPLEAAYQTSWQEFPKAMKPLLG